MTPKRKTGIALLVLAVLLYLAFGIAQIGFDYPLLIVLALVIGIVGLVMVLTGGKKVRTHV